MATLTSRHNLKVFNPKVSKQWHPTKNGELTPKDILPHARYKAWWVCKQGHEWRAAIFSRTVGSGCPYCNHKYPTKEYNLGIINPELAKEWHAVKNGNLTPRDVNPGANRKVWWICKKGHEWEASVTSRNSGSGCPYCDSKKACLDNCLQTRYPSLVKEWHPNKNGKLTPLDVTYGSSRIVWWQCKKGHSWKATPNSRTSGGSGCRRCWENKTIKGRRARFLEFTNRMHLKP